MKMNLMLCLLAVWTLAASAQNSAQPSPADRSMLIALENAWNQAQLHHDSKALDALVADPLSAPTTMELPEQGAVPRRQS